MGLDPARALRLLSTWHVLGALEPGLGFDPKSAVALRRVGRGIAVPAWPAQRWRPWVTGFAVWLAPLPPQLRRRALRRLAVRGSVADRIAGMPRLRDRALRGLARARGRGSVDAALQDVSEEELHALYAWAEPALRRRIARFAAEDRQRRLPINGQDVAGLGLSGPTVGKALAQVRRAMLDGAVKTRDEALALAAEVGRGRSGSTRRRS
jgi:hypothetical protein